MVETVERMTCQGKNCTETLEAESREALKAAAFSHHWWREDQGDYYADYCPNCTRPRQIELACQLGEVRVEAP